MSGFYRMEVKVISKTGKRQNGAVGENSAQSASAYITASKVDTLSPVDASAYISGNKVETKERSADYTKKKGVLSSNIVLPANAPDRLRDPSVLWSEVDQMAKRSNADLYREWICCFEKHLTLEQMEKVAKQFAESLAAEGMVVQYALHDEKSNGNYHVHFMAPCRGIDESGNWQKRKVLPRTFQLDAEGNRIPIIDKEPPKQYVSKYTHGRTAINIESAFASIVSYYQRLQNDYNTTQAAQEQTADMLMDTTAKLVQAQDDLLIMCSTGMTGIMENHLRQGEYDLTREVVEVLSKELLQEGQDAELRSKLDRYKDRIRIIQSGNDETVGTAGSDNSNSTGGKRETERRADRINELSRELQESAIRLGIAEQESAETAKRLSILRCRDAAERDKQIKKAFGKGRSR